LLAQNVVHSYNGKVKFVVENFGDSELARRFGVTRYPAIFIDDVLVAKPKDFGFYGKGEGSGDGRYTPWKDPRSHEHFRSDLKRMIDLVLNNKKEDLRKERSQPEETLPVATLPSFQAKDLNGHDISSDGWKGKAVLVEFWATWCPPCRSTLSWLGEMKKHYGDKLEIVTVAVESDEADVQKITKSLNIPVTWIMGTPELAQRFGDVNSVPTMLLFDQQGKAQNYFLGAPPDLHQSAQAAIETLTK
jgi:thiol-disulfide isomerase/thioredoxin